MLWQDWPLIPMASTSSQEVSQISLLFAWLFKCRIEVTLFQATHTLMLTHTYTFHRAEPLFRTSPYPIQFDIGPVRCSCIYTFSYGNTQPHISVTLLHIYILLWKYTASYQCDALAYIHSLMVIHSLISV